MHTLDTLLSFLEAQVPPERQPAWVRFSHIHRGRDFELGINGDIDALLGWTAPARCFALGIVAGGWATVLDDPEVWAGLGADEEVRVPSAWSTADSASTADPPPPGAGPAAPPHHPERERIRVLCLVDREGRVAARATYADGRRFDDAPSAGRVMDNLRRCFRLPTDPPGQPPGSFICLQWMAAVLERAAKTRGTLPWSAVLESHPAWVLLQRLEEPIPPEHTLTLMRVADRAWTWERLREQAGQGELVHDLVAPEVARWMDDGMFSRWMLEGLPPLGHLVDRVDQVIDPADRRSLREALAACGAALREDRPLSWSDRASSPDSPPSARAEATGKPEPSSAA